MDSRLRCYKTDNEESKCSYVISTRVMADLEDARNAGKCRCRIVEA